MKIDQSTMENVCIFLLAGRLDAASASLLRKRLTVEPCREFRMVVDLSAIDFMDSSGLGALVSGARWLRQHHGDLKLACLGDKVRRVFEMTRADRLFDIYDDAKTAAESFSREETA